MSRKDFIIHTADQEEPDCMRCEHVCEASYLHSSSAG